MVSDGSDGVGRPTVVANHSQIVKLQSQWEMRIIFIGKMYFKHYNANRSYLRQALVIRRPRTAAAAAPIAADPVAGPFRQPAMRQPASNPFFGASYVCCLRPLAP
jgi:hypothetical protein